jgi:hypothetical protein
MAATTITVKKETRDKLVNAKLAEGFSSIDELLNEWHAAYRLQRLQEESEKFRRRMKEKGLTLKDLIK